MFLNIAQFSTKYSGALNWWSVAFIRFFSSKFCAFPFNLEFAVCQIITLASTLATPECWHIIFTGAGGNLHNARRRPIISDFSAATDYFVSIEREKKEFLLAADITRLRESVLTDR